MSIADTARIDRDSQVIKESVDRSEKSQRTRDVICWIVIENAVRLRN